jgi:hypothetical protein
MRVQTANVLAVALLAMLAEQILHEATHGVVAVLVGRRWEMWNLFAVGSSWPDELAGSAWGTGLTAGSAAAVNIFCGVVCVLAFTRPWLASRPMWRLFVFYFGSFSLFAGFGYLMVDPLFYKAGGTNIGDWKTIVQLLGGGWAARLPIAVAGMAGVLWGFFWVPRAALQFGEGELDRAGRARVALSLLVVPYLVVNTVMTLLALWHPLGISGLWLVVFKQWFGFFGFFWGFFMASHWLTVKPTSAARTPLPSKISLPWVAASMGALVLSSAVLLPSIRF